MDDTELDRALKSALSVSPSPEFLPRVRQSIAATKPAPSGANWLIPASVALGLLAAVVWQLPEGTPIADVPVHHGADISLAPPQSVMTESRSPAPTAPSRISKSFQDKTKATGLPFEVMVSPADVAAYRRLFATRDAIDYQSPIEPRKMPEQSAVTAIDIAPIVIRPLNDSEETGVFQ
jgi:hypothetical protein